MAALADQKVPLEDSDKLRLMVHNQVYRKMLGDNAWVQESLVSAVIAKEARERADLAHAFNFQVIWDQQMPTASGAILYGQVSVTNGSSAITGLNTAFTQQLVAGSSYLVFGNDPTKTQYKVNTVTNDSAVVLASNYAGLTATTTARLITNLAGTVAIANTGVVTGTSTAFTTALAVGQWLAVAGDTNTGSQLYQIATITSNTAATVVGSAAGTGWPTTSIATGIATVQSFTNLALHEYAIALALRPIATPDEARNVVDVTYIDLMGIPLRVMVSYVHLYQALFVTVDFGYALGVIRPDFGVIIQS